MSEYSEFLPEAVRIAEEASAIAASYFRQAILIETKADQSPVTIADKKGEEHIRKELGKRFPGHGILGEEFGTEALDADFVWTIDPIDGTRSFIRGIPLFGTLLGLLHRRRVVLGIMVLPILQETYTAVLGKGTFCNDQRLHVSPTQTLENAVVSIGDVNCFEKAGKMAYMHQIMEKAELARGYTDCFGHSLLLRGAVDAMIDPVVAPWDVIPIACLVREAGGEFFDFDGGQTLETSSFISCAPGLKQALLNLK
ncbi:MAG: inositol monophosphatase family protein [Bdellovibrionota bacterium]